MLFSFNVWKSFYFLNAGTTLSSLSNSNAATLHVLPRLAQHQSPVDVSHVSPVVLHL